MERFGWVEVGEDTVAAGEGRRRHESAGEEVAFLDERGVEEGGEGGGVEEGDDAGVGGDERTRWDVDSEHR